MGADGKELCAGAHNAMTPYAGCTVADIARAVGVSRVTLYRHLKDEA